MEEGNSFSLLVCPQGGGGRYLGPGQDRGYPKVPTPPAKVPTPPPSQVRIGGRGYPKVQPDQDGGYPKVPTPFPDEGTYPAPQPGQDRGYPRYLTPPPPPAKVPTPQARSGWGRGYPKVPTPQPRYLPPSPGQVRTGEGGGLVPLAKDLLHGGRYASCVHTGGLSCVRLKGKEMVIRKHNVGEGEITFELGSRGWGNSTVCY